MFELTRPRLAGWLSGPLVLLLLAAASLASETVTPLKKVLVIGIDGCRYDALAAAHAQNLDSLVAQGYVDPQCQILGSRYQANDTISGPGWSSILTGVWADKHGVDDNAFKSPNYARYPHMFELLKRVRPQAFTASFVTWEPIQEQIVTAADLGRITRTEQQSYEEGDAQAAREAAQLIATGDPTLVFLYFGQVDEIGHQHGFHPSVPEYVQAIERVDRLVGEVLHQMRTRRTAPREDWLVIVTSDHGGQGTSHSSGHAIPEIRNSFLIVSGPSARRGEAEERTSLVDVVPTALAHLGVASDSKWDLDGQVVGLRPAGQVVFREHTLSAETEFSACAAIDVDGDGTLDVVNGGWWYQAPQWTRHFVRNVERIGNRFDDYSHLPLDVNRDGRLDLVSANYRSRSLYWVENRGTESVEWPKHEIAVPGAMETARLYDVDADGQLDVLPNGVEFAAWWTLEHDESGQPKWTRYDLPAELAGHGIGCGDINGDGRADIVGPRGWAEAPADPRRDRWVWHGEFRLHRDAGIPILVFDVDQDGDNDLVWSRGHQIGLYWLEQVAKDNGREWVSHTIDTSLSQAHSLLLADLDADGRQDLIAGKRYLGHDGKDAGEHDPLASYWYRFDPAQRVWQRQVISWGTRAAFGLDPKVIDLDADGDLDLLAADRSGVYWLENLLRTEQPADPAPRSEAPPAHNHQELLQFVDAQGEQRPVTSPAEWGQRRQDILWGMQQVMGALPGPERRVPLDVQWHDKTELEKYTRHRISFVSEPGDRVPAYLLVPHHLQTPAPAMLCLHQTIGIGKDELAGLGGRPTRWFAHELAEYGYLCLVPDYPSFGEYPYDFQTQGSHYASGSMKAIWNNLRAVDLLESLPQVDPDRIGAMGHSLGGHNALFTAAFDRRIQLVVTSCGFTPFHHYYGGNLAGWTSDRYMPRIRDVHQNNPDNMPFDFYEVLAAIAPRGIFINAPLHDSNFDVEGVKKLVPEVRRVYELLGSEPEQLQVEYPDSEHDFPDEVRQRAFRWIDERFKD